MQKKKYLFFLITIFLSPLLISCGIKRNPNVKSICLEYRSACLQGKVSLIMTTNRGEITLEINGNTSPITAGNFLDLVKKGVYKNTVFHRVIKKPSPFLIQGGDPLTKISSIQKKQFGTGNYIDPKNGQARFIPLEIKLKDETKPRYNSLIQNPNKIKKIELIHSKGALAMARSIELNSSSSQFYITLKSLPELDGRYSVFGYVINGMNIVQSIEEGDKILDIKVIKRKYN